MTVIVGRRRNTRTSTVVVPTAPPPLHVPGDNRVIGLHGDEVIGVVVKFTRANLSSWGETPWAGHVAMKSAEAAAFGSALLGSDARVRARARVALAEVSRHIGALRIAWAWAEVFERRLSRRCVDVCGNEFRTRADGSVPNAAWAERREETIAAL